MTKQTDSKPSPSGHVAGKCRPDQTLKKPKYLSVCDREERDRGEGALSCELNIIIVVVVYLQLNKNRRKTRG